MVSLPPDLPMNRIRELCGRFSVRELSLFGSAVQGRWTPDSDLDFLVDFQPDARVGFLTLAALTRELSDLIGRRVDVVPKAGLKPVIREEVLAQAEVLFAA